MIYIVSGFMRTGTSMMMQALVAGGLEAAYSNEREKLNDILGDKLYKPNSGGFFEVAVEEYNEIGFPLKYQDKLIKVMSWALNSIAVNDAGYRIILMRRNAEEIRQSCDAALEKKLKGFNEKEYCSRMDDLEKRMRNRKDVISFTSFWYRDVIENAVETMQVLKDLGWPINVIEAVNAIDPSKYRFRLENLVVGI